MVLDLVLLKYLDDGSVVFVGQGFHLDGTLDRVPRERTPEVINSVYKDRDHTALFSGRDGCETYWALALILAIYLVLNQIRRLARHLMEQTKGI